MERQILFAKNILNQPACSRLTVRTGGGGVLYGHITDEEEKTAVEEHFQLLYKEHMLGLAMDWTGPQSSAMVDKKLFFSAFL